MLKHILSLSTQIQYEIKKWQLYLYYRNIKFFFCVQFFFFAFSLFRKTVQQLISYVQEEKYKGIKVFAFQQISLITIYSIFTKYFGKEAVKCAPWNNENRLFQINNQQSHTKEITDWKWHILYWKVRASI